MVSFDIQSLFTNIPLDETINICVEYTVSDSFSFLKEMKDQDSSLFMASFDIQSLFTNIPLDETMNIYGEYTVSDSFSF